MLMLMNLMFSGFSNPRLIAIRYIAGILELPTLWADVNYKTHRDVVKKLCEWAVRLIGDINIVTRRTTKDSDKLDRFQTPEGVDLLAEGVLLGVRGWIEKQPGDLARERCWVIQTLILINTLKWQVCSDIMCVQSNNE